MIFIFQDMLVFYRSYTQYQSFPNIIEKNTKIKNKDNNSIKVDKKATKACKRYREIFWKHKYLPEYVTLIDLFN